MITLIWSKYTSTVWLITALATGFMAGVLADQLTVDCHLEIVKDATSPAVFSQVPPECDTHLWFESASKLDGPWTVIADASKPFILPKVQQGNQFFRTASNGGPYLEPGVES